MSLFLDQKYLTLISNRLPLFKRKGSSYNCRCVICGDSAKKQSKARGYFYANKNSLMYKCFNCDASMYFSTFLKNIDSQLYNEYNFESYSESKLANSNPKIVFEQPKFNNIRSSALEDIMLRLDNLPNDHEAIRFCEQRKIPKEKYKNIFFVENIKDVVKLNDKYTASITTNEPRIVFPFYDFDGTLTAVTCRAIRGEALRYITVKVFEDRPLIFGLNKVNNDKDVIVVEGPIDSLFLNNSIAIAGTSLTKTNNNITKEKMIVVFDNQPRNKEVCKIILKTIKNGYKVVIWPQNIFEKDINEMVLSGKDVNKIIEQNTFIGLEAEVRYTAWKRV